jgi:GNAT superfamily N-acetyltransferase
MASTEQSLEIRNASLEDAAAIAALLDELGFPTPDESVASRLTTLLAVDEVILVAARGSEPLALLTVHVRPVLRRSTPVGRLTALVVAERVLGQGIGRALVATAERIRAARGWALVEVTSNQRLCGAHASYHRMGYEVTSLRLKKSLAPPA